MEKISLSTNVLLALDFFTLNKIPLIDIGNFRFPFVVGSGNAYNTGLILFSKHHTVFADESNFKTLLNAYLPVIKSGLIKDAVIISASGEKDSVWEIELAKREHLTTTLFTTKAKSTAGGIADKVYVFKSIDEPYTYNVSSYMGMILSATKENPDKITNFIKSLSLPKNFKDYEAYAFILQDKYTNICPMIDIKKNELFGPHLSLRAFSSGQARHAKFIHRWEKELVISLGFKNLYFGHPEHKFAINLPDYFDFAGVMALTYYLVGKIQEAKTPYYQKDIAGYCANYGPKAYGSTKPFEEIVPGAK